VERPDERDAGHLVFFEKRFDVFDRDECRKELFLLPRFLRDHRLVYEAQVQRRAVAGDRAVEGGVPVKEVDGEPELVAKTLAAARRAPSARSNSRIPLHAR